MASPVAKIQYFSLVALSPTLSVNLSARFNRIVVVVNELFIQYTKFVALAPLYSPPANNAYPPISPAAPNDKYPIDLVVFTSVSLCNISAELLSTSPLLSSPLLNIT